MARVAGIGHLQRFRSGRRDELEGMGPHVGVGELLLNLRHVASDAFIPGASGGVMRVRLNGGRVGAVRRFWAVAFHAKNVGGLEQVGIVFSAVRIMAAIAAYAVGVHRALNEIVALHPIFCEPCRRRSA